MTTFSDNIKSFIDNNTWIFAKTYAETWVHEYIVQEKVDNDLFIEGNLEVNSAVFFDSVASVADNNQVLTLDSGEVKYIDTTNWDKSTANVCNDRLAPGVWLLALCSTSG